MAPVEEPVRDFADPEPDQGIGANSIGPSHESAAEREWTADEAEFDREKYQSIRKAIQDGSSSVVTRDRGADGDKFFITENRIFISAVGFITFANMIVLGIETDYGCREGWHICSYDQRMSWYIVENLFTILMLIEIAIRIVGEGPLMYFRGESLENHFGCNVLNCVDVVIVALRCVDTWILALAKVQTPIKVISCFRIVRIAELVKRSPTMRSFREIWVILHGIAYTSRSVFWTLIMLLIILYVSAIVMTDTVVKQSNADMFDYSASAWKLQPWTVRDYWGTVPGSLFSLMQVVTLDHWCSTLARPLVIRSPAFILLFIPFLIIAILGLMNVIVAIIVECALSSAAANKEKVNKETIKLNARVMESLKAMIEEADTDGSGELDRKELKKAWRELRFRERMKLLDIQYKDLTELFDLLDEDKIGCISVDKYFRGVSRLRGAALSADLHQMTIDFGRYISWCADLVMEHRSCNDRLAALLADIEGLDRDVVKSEEDQKDPVLMARRRRFKKQQQEKKQQGFAQLMYLQDVGPEDGMSDAHEPETASQNSRAIVASSNALHPSNAETVTDVEKFHPGSEVAGRRQNSASDANQPANPRMIQDLKAVMESNGMGQGATAALEDLQAASSRPISGGDNAAIVAVPTSPNESLSPASRKAVIVSR